MFTVTRTMAASPDAAWDLLASTGTWARWGPSVTAVEPADTLLSAGLVGRVRTPLGIWLPFRITHLDPGRSWAWSIAGLPATSHRVDTAPGGCSVTFEVPGPALPYLLICRTALRRIAAEIES